MPAAVLDTNVLVSGILHADGPPGKILDAWKARRFELLVSPDILAEYREVLSRPKLRKYHGLDGEGVRALVAGMEKIATLVEPGAQLRLADFPDPGDLMLLECAQAGKADYLITGDKALPALGNWRETRILSPGAFAAGMGSGQ